MKIPKLAVWYIKRSFDKRINNALKTFKPDENIPAKYDIPFDDDLDERHKFNIYYASEKRKNICIIDIHGGSYLFGHRIENYELMTYFQARGFDFITADYIPVQHGRNVIDIVRDVANCISYISTHLKELNLEKDQFVIMGDSAGGHLALLLSEMIKNPDFAKKITAKPLNLDIKGVLVNCPVYDYFNLGWNSMTHAACRFMFGQSYKNKEERKLICPREHIDELKDFPIFLSTCKNDFIRNESLLFHQDLESKKQKHIFIDLNSDKKEIGHVHNILHIEEEESRYINDQMIDFINNLK